MNDLKMPAEFYGEVIKSNGATKSNPRLWTEEEILWILEKKSLGYKNPQIAKAIGRTEVSIELKLRRRKKIKNTYNLETREIKYSANQKFLQELEPITVLDLYAGDSFYKTYPNLSLTTNDKDIKFDTDYHYDALELLCKLVSENKKFDLIDLDPYGSSYECIDLAIRQAKSGLIISFGEWGHRKFNRFDYVGPRYGINSLETFTEDLFIKTVQDKAFLQKKTAKVVDIVKYNNFMRIYFTLDDK